MLELALGWGGDGSGVRTSTIPGHADVATLIAVPRTNLPPAAGRGTETWDIRDACRSDDVGSMRDGLRGSGMQGKVVLRAG